MRRFAPVFAFALSLCAAAMAGKAQIAAPFDARVASSLDESAPELFALLQESGTYDFLKIISNETVASAPEVDAAFLGRLGGDSWTDTTATTYDITRLVGAFEAALDRDAFAPADITELLEFYRSDLGRRIVSGEIGARREMSDTALLDRAYEEAAALAEDDPRLALIMELRDLNAFVDRNVSATLNANASFMFGLADGGAVPFSESDILAQTVDAEAEVRAEVVRWLTAYHLLAYAEITDEELARYIAVTQTPAGRAFTAAIFAAADEVFTASQYALGRAAASALVTDDI